MHQNSKSRHNWRIFRIHFFGSSFFFFFNKVATQNVGRQSESLLLIWFHWLKNPFSFFFCFFATWTFLQFREKNNLQSFIFYLPFPPPLIPPTQSSAFHFTLFPPSLPTDNNPYGLNEWKSIVWIKPKASSSQLDVFTISKKTKINHV